MPKAAGSTGRLVDAAAVEGHNGADARRTAPSADSARAGCKRKLGDIVQAPSPRRTTRQYSIAQKSQEVPHVVDGEQRTQTRRRCGKGILVEDNTKDYVKGKTKIE